MRMSVRTKDGKAVPDDTWPPQFLGTTTFGPSSNIEKRQFDEAGMQRVIVALCRTQEGSNGLLSYWRPAKQQPR